STRWAAGSKWGTPEAMKAPFASWIELDLGEDRSVDSTAVAEGWDRTRAFRIECRSRPEDEWQVALVGTTLGGDYHNDFPKVTGRYWRLNILEASTEPSIWEWQLFNSQESGEWRKCVEVGPDAFQGNTAELEIDLRPFITQPGQFLVRCDNQGDSDCTLEDIKLLYNGREVLEGMLSTVKAGELYNINRTAAVVPESRIVLKVRFKTDKLRVGAMEVLVQRAF
ncbi:MAG: hypothetical protein KAI66_27975, partial [Lentisphaeria bacterium]|nr:hypothetical protein [Lentisphaeria bacterium]